MSGLQVFQNPAFGAVRTIAENGETLFCGVDIAKPLAYKNPYKAVSDHCRYVTKRYIPHPQNPEKEIEMIFIPEGDVYRLIARSKLPAAEQFERWIFDEVVPSIRKHGAYLTPETLEAAILNPDFLIQLAEQLKAERERRQRLEADNAALQAQIEADAPRVRWAIAAEGSERGTLIREFCKFLRPLGVEIGEKRMFADLRDGGWLVKVEGRDRNTPTQRAVDMGLFTVRETVIAKPDGTTVTRTTPLLTEKGKQYFAKRYLSGKGVTVSADA